MPFSSQILATSAFPVIKRSATAPMLEYLFAKAITGLLGIFSTFPERAPVAQHFMILKALENGVPEERLSEALGLNPRNIRVRRDLLNGICPEAVQLLRNRKVAIGVFAVLRKMKAVRQLEAAEHMVAGTTYSVAFAKALLAVTKPELLVGRTRKPKMTARSLAAQEMLGVETERLVRDLKMIEESYGNDVLALTVCSSYLRKMLANPRVERHLLRDHPSLLEAIREAIAD
jgi:hypothetical protein